MNPKKEKKRGREEERRRGREEERKKRIGWMPEKKEGGEEENLVHNTLFCPKTSPLATE